jgi:hypothetical protein
MPAPFIVGTGNKTAYAAHWALNGTTRRSCFQVIIPMGSGPVVKPSGNPRYTATTPSSGIIIAQCLKGFRVVSLEYAHPREPHPYVAPPEQNNNA